ncbi:IMP dehydrogenase [Candidatus Woesearchaeota archaeon]|nr:IMP dehydrogenase [Candidatus Woesearchaeota archaeon]
MGDEPVEKLVERIKQVQKKCGFQTFDEAAEFLLSKEGPGELKVALSFDDVTLEQDYSDFLPQDADVRTRISRNIEHNIPIISAAMDTVTESEMAKEMAQLGGSGVIHRNMPTERQVEKVKKVKKAWNLVVEEPLTVRSNYTVRDVKRIMNETKFGGLPVVRGKHVMIGIITRKDLKYEPNLDARVKDVMTPADKRLRYVRYNKDFSQQEYFRRAAKIFQKCKIDHLPVVIREGERFILKGLITHEDVRKRRTYKDACLRDERLVVGAAVGCALRGKDNDIQRAEALVQDGKVDYLVIDSSHGYSQGVIDTLKALKEILGDSVDIIAGNVCNGSGAAELLRYGADGIKVGIGPGSICTTRRQTGAGIPQITATRNVALVAAQYGVPVTTDGGLEYPGHISKSIAAGAWAVMLGSVLAGTYESPGRVKREKDGKRVKDYRGMGSLDAMLEGSADRYEESELIEDLDLRDEDVTDLPLEQGISTTVEYKGYVFRIINECVQGLKHGMGLAGNRTIEELRRLDNFYEKFKRITSEGQRESGIHGLK